MRTTISQTVRKAQDKEENARLTWVGFTPDLAALAAPNPRGRATATGLTIGGQERSGKHALVDA